MKGLKSKLITTILDETGIRLHPKDFQISTIDNMLILKLWNTELIRKKFQSEKSLESDEFAEDLLTELFDEFFDVREKIIEIKKEDLNRTYLEEIKDKVIKNLKSKKIAPGIIEGLDFEFIDYINSKSGKLGDDWGLPLIGLRITDFEGVDYFHPVDIYKEPLVFDDKAISDEFVKKLR